MDKVILSHGDQPCLAGEWFAVWRMFHSGVKKGSIDSLEDASRSGASCNANLQI